MYRKLFLAVLPSTLALAATAFAQTAWVEIADDVTVAEFGGQNVDAIDDWDVFGPDGAEIGEVEDVLGVEAGTATALSVEFEDAAGYGDRDDVIVPLDQFTFADNKLTLNADAAAVSAMEVYDDQDDD